MSEVPAVPGKALRVLIVEDESRLRDVLVTAVREMGFATRSARSGEEALRLMTESPDDTLIVDLNLPGMDGMDFFENVRQRWPATRVIVLTGRGSLEAAQRAIRLDVVDFFSKPVSLGDLERALHRAHQRHGAQKVHIPKDEEADKSSQKTLEELEKQQIYAALERNNGSRRLAAAELGISVRAIYYKLASYGQADSNQCD